MAQKKRTFNSCRKSGRKTTAMLTDLSSKSETCNGLSNTAEVKVETLNNDKRLSNCKELVFKSFDSMKRYNLRKKTDSSIVQSPSKKPLDHLTKSSSSINCISNLRSIIDKVNKLQIHPPIHIYSITPEGKGISAVDVSQNLSNLAYSFSHSQEINLFARKSLSDNIARNDLRSTWLNFVSARNQFTTVEKCEKEKEEMKCLSSPQIYKIKHEDVSSLCFSSDDNLLMSSSFDGSVKVISTTTYAVLDHYDSYGRVTDIDINMGVTQFVTANAISWNPFYLTYLYSFERKDPILSFSGHTNSLKYVRFHPNGLYFATTASDRCIKLWNVHQSKEVRSFIDEGIDQPEKITFSPDGKYIASTYSGCVKIWDIASGRKLKCLQISSSEPGLLNICYNLDGSILAAGGLDKQIHFWNISDKSSEITPDYHLLKSEDLGKTIFSLKSVSNFFSCVTG